MQATMKTQAFLRRRKMMLVLPVLTLPFLTMAFWAMGGGKGNTQEKGFKQAGLNLQLPEPKLEDEGKETKLSFYDKAQEDSLKLRQEMLSDPYYKNGLDTMSMPVRKSGVTGQTSFINKRTYSPYYSPRSNDSNEARIYEQVNALNAVLQQPATIKFQEEAVRQNKNRETANLSADVNRLETLMQSLTDNERNDPEMAQMETLLDKILDIQHPERIKDRIKEKSIQDKTRVFAVNRFENSVQPSFLHTRAIRADSLNSRKHNAFYGLGNATTEAYEDNAIAAAVQEAQTVTDGATVKLRLLTDIYINGLLLKKGSFVFGIAALENERLLIHISGIRQGNNLLPVALSAYDMDGIAGIYIPRSISKEVVKESSDQGLQRLQLMSLDPSLKTQAAAAGVQAAKGLLSRKIRQVKVTVKAGYKVVLKNDRQ